MPTATSPARGRKQLQSEAHLLPNYGINDAARYLRVPTSTVRFWVRGDIRRQGGQLRENPPVVQMADPARRLLSFMNLVEIHVLDALLHGPNSRLSLQRIRAGLAKFYESVHYQAHRGNPLVMRHPLAMLDFGGVGRDLLVRSVGNIANLNRGGQLEIEEVIGAYLQRVSRREDGTPILLYPFPKKHLTVIDSDKPVSLAPQAGFGRLVVEGTRIPVEMLVQRQLGGDSIEHLAEDYELAPEKIAAAIRYWAETPEAA